MNHERPAPPLAVELSRPVQRACRREPELARAINQVLLRAARRLRLIIDETPQIRVAGRAEGIVLELRLTPPDGCRVEAVHQGEPESSPDLTV